MQHAGCVEKPQGKGTGSSTHRAAQLQGRVLGALCLLHHLLLRFPCSLQGLRVHSCLQRHHQNPLSGSPKNLGRALGTMTDAPHTSQVNLITCTLRTPSALTERVMWSGFNLMHNVLCDNKQLLFLLFFTSNSLLQLHCCHPHRSWQSPHKSKTELILLLMLYFCKS